jgi:2,6-dihydroxypseudooxynicotine hydrolase
VTSDLAEIVEHRLPRLLVAGVDYNDVRLVLSCVKDMHGWLPKWKQLAAMHEELGDAALEQGNTITAADALRRASLYYHVAQFVYFDNADEKYAVQQAQQSAYRKGMLYFRPATEQIAIIFENITFTGNLRLPEGRDGRLPCVILMAGADSTKEEFFTLENEFLRRGLATISFDGPGQGTTWRAQKLRADYERPVAAAIDRLSIHPRIDPDRIGIWGRSFGGYAAPRAAALEKRLKACVSIGGFYDMGAIWSRFPASTKEALMFGFGVDSEEQAQTLSRAYTLAGLLNGLACPLLIVHSGMDEVCPVTESQQIRAEAAGSTDLRVFPEGNHVCDNIPYKVRPLMADWMVQQLG